jgi:hypothetical protein
MTGARQCAVLHQQAVARQRSFGEPADRGFDVARTVGAGSWR